MKVEEARPKRVTEVPIAGKNDDDTTSARKTSRRRKSDANRDGTLSGIRLPDERKVKRGWTEPGTASKTRSKKEKTGVSTEKKKPKRKSESITGKEECLFKTKLPPNARSIEAEKSEHKKKRKQDEPPNGETVVHEFKNNTKHATFLREKSGTASTKPVVEYVDGKGWVNEDGFVVEQAPSKAAPRSTNSRSKRKTAVSPAASETSSSGTSSSESDESEDQDAALPTVLATVEKPNTRNKTSAHELKPSNKAATQPDGLERLSIVRSSATPPPTTSDISEPHIQSSEPHPLETLFKRPAKAASHAHTPRKPNLEVSTSFSFFDPDGHEQEAVQHTPQTAVPQTPFTQQDLRERRQRSAAPTPDTAAPGKTFSSVFGEGQSSPIPSEDEEDEEDDEAGQSGSSLKTAETPMGGVNAGGEESQFAKWFWEHRGENNRAWKRRRREAAKENRQRENRRRKE